MYGATVESLTAAAAAASSGMVRSNTEGRATWGYLIQAVPRSVASTSTQDPNCDDQDEMNLGSRVSQQTDHGNVAPALTRRVQTQAGSGAGTGAPGWAPPSADVWLTELSSMNVTYTLGRRNCRMHVRHSIRQYISRDHCRLSSVCEGTSDDGAYIHDISANGTYVNGTQIPRDRPTKLEDGDVISLVSPHVVESNAGNQGELGSLEAFLFVFRETTGGAPANPGTSSNTMAAAGNGPESDTRTTATRHPRAAADTSVASFITGASGRLPNNRVTGASRRRDQQQVPRQNAINLSAMNRAGSSLSIGNLSDFLSNLGMAVGSRAGADGDSGANEDNPVIDGLFDETGVEFVSPTARGARRHGNDHLLDSMQQQQANRAMAFGLRRILPGLRGRNRRTNLLSKPIMPPHPHWHAKKMKRVVYDAEEVPLR